MPDTGVVSVASNARDLEKCAYCGGPWDVRPAGRQQLPACRMCRSAWQRQSVGRRDWSLTSKTVVLVAFCLGAALIGCVAGLGGEQDGN